MKRGALRTLLILGALLVGVTSGLLVFAFQFQPGLTIAGYVNGAGVLWTNALRMSVIPLLVPTLIVVIARGTSKEIGKISAVTFVTFFSLMAIGVTLVFLVLPPTLSSLGVEKRVVPTQEAQANAVVSEQEGEPGEKDPGLSSIIATLLAPNLVRAAATDDLLPLVVFSILLGLAVTHIEQKKRELLISVLTAFSAAMQVLIDWILWLMPVGVLAFTFSATATIGWSTVGMLGAWIAIICVLCFVLTVLLYFVATMVGQVSLKSFAKAVLPAQGVGAAARSSLAALPALLSGAKRHLQTNETVANIVLPLSVSSFKLNRSLTSAARLLFLGYIYDVSLSPLTMATFLVTVLLLSFSSPGLPARGPTASLPFYLAVGIPLEGILILRSVVSINDYPMTVLNVTGDMTAATLVARFIKGKENRAAVPEMSSETSEAVHASSEG